jgi:hypothetical protein
MRGPHDPAQQDPQALPEGHRPARTADRDLIRKTGAPPKDCPCFSVKDWFEREVKPKYPEAAYIQAVKYI